ncbi:MAG TPA: hypothetical protein DIC42_06900, partial [Holosporales bacterium]|nr:hypothetical protein [Holosporales bacterium]
RSKTFNTIKNLHHCLEDLNCDRKRVLGRIEVCTNTTQDGRAEALKHYKKQKKFYDAQKEAVGEATMLRAGYVKLESKLPGNKGFDGVYVKWEKPGVPADIIIVESKYATSGEARMAELSGGGKQMDQQWVLDKIDAMQKIDNPALKAAGKLLEDNLSLIRRRVNVIDAKGHNSWTKVDLPHAPQLGE